MAVSNPYPRNYYLTLNYINSGNFGDVVNVELSMDRNGQIDGNMVSVKFTLAQRPKASSPVKAIPPPPPPKRELPPKDKILAGPEKEVAPRPRERGTELGNGTRGLLEDLWGVDN
ncbi:hypothetical protein KSP40_PGU022739 [Platanthera guangdongensis]|uniref:Uncharacterized protein n=1 Tax=Platanthera guangdongensis TaxID=2320717 RepID=A0ABR2LST1_9ASPA